jgi:T-complex protein 1 subunit eta
MVVDAVTLLDPELCDIRLIGIKKVTGGSVTDSQLIQGVAFKKTFSYAGFEQQPKHLKDPKILLLNVELELKSEKENAEVYCSHFFVRLWVDFSICTNLYTVSISFTYEISTY